MAVEFLGTAILVFFAQLFSLLGPGFPAVLLQKFALRTFGPVAAAPGDFMRVFIGSHVPRMLGRNRDLRPVQGNPTGAGKVANGAKMRVSVLIHRGQQGDPHNACGCRFQPDR